MVCSRFAQRGGILEDVVVLGDDVVVLGRSVHGVDVHDVLVTMAPMRVGAMGSLSTADG